MPANKTAGGILVGFRDDLFDIISHTCFKYCVSVIVLDKRENVTWQLITVYGTAYYDSKLEFIAELHDIMEKSVVPTLFGGDFNLVRSAADKSNGKNNANWSFLFNDWVNKWALIEFKLSNRSFTWSNNQNFPVMATLDRVFATNCFPLTSIKTLPKPISDHTPILLDSRSNHVVPPKVFRFEK